MKEILGNTRKLTFLGVFISFGLITQAQSFEEEIKELKKQARLNYNEGVRFAKEGKMTKAHMKFDSAILIYSEFELPYLERAKIKLLDNDIDLALKDISKAIELNDMLGEAFYVRAYIKMLMKDHQNALTDFTHAIQKGFTESQAYYYLCLLNF